MRSAKRLESTVKAEIARELKQTPGLWFVKTHGGPMQRAGLPDFLVCYRGRFIGLEVKRDWGMGPTPVQQLEMDRVQAAGGLATVVWSAEMVRALLALVEGGR